MPYRPLVSKIRVHNPNKVHASVANKNYVKYIATREGVALDDPVDMDGLLELPGMENVDMDEGVVHGKVSNANYLRYIACRPRSHGLFGNIDTSDLNSVMREVSDVSKQNRVVYRGIISLSEKDAEALNFKATADWNRYLRKVMPGLAKELGVSPTDHTWVAAFHGEKTHPHVHYELWDNRDRVKSPFIHVSTQKRCREFLSREMFDSEYERMISKVYKQELEELYRIRNWSRASILRRSGEVVEESLYVPGVSYEVLPGVMDRSYAELIKDEVNTLVRIMVEEGHGRLMYKFFPGQAKAQVDRIAKILCGIVGIQKEIERYVEAVGETQNFHGKTGEERKAAENAAREDIHKRICNKVLKVVKDNYDISTGKQLRNGRAGSKMEKSGQGIGKEDGLESQDKKAAGKGSREGELEEGEKVSGVQDFHGKEMEESGRGTGKEGRLESQDRKAVSKGGQEGKPGREQEVGVGQYQGEKAEKVAEGGVAGKGMPGPACNRVSGGMKDGRGFSSVVQPAGDGMGGQGKNKVRDLEGIGGRGKPAVEAVGGNFQAGDWKGGQAGKEVLEAGEPGMFDINLSYLLVRAVLEETKKQTKIQKAKAFGYDKENRSWSRQNIKEELRKNKDSSREPSQN